METANRNDDHAAQSAQAPVSYGIVDRVARIVIDHPPVNALSAVVRAALLQAIADAERDEAVGAVLLEAGGRTWPAGADIREFDLGPLRPSLAEVCDAVDQCSKPVVAHLHGTVLGGGLELALAAHVRLAEPSCSLGMPEAALGLVPGAGGTRRLPHLIGAEAALGLMLTGLPVGTTGALELGLVDAILNETNPKQHALAAAVELIDRPIPAARPRRDSPAVFLDAVTAARAGLRGSAAPGLPAPRKIIDCVEASLLLSPDAAATMERTAFEDLVATAESRGLRHAFLSERRALKHSRLDPAKSERVERVAVAGGGAAGADLAAAFLSAGCSVALGAEDTDSLAAGLSRIAAAEELAVSAGRLTVPQRDAEWERLSGGLGLAGFAGADVGLLVGTRAADAALAAAQAMSASALLVLVDAADDVTARAAVTGRGERVIGLSFVGPSGAKRLSGLLAEIIAPPAAGSDAVATGVALARRLGTVPVIARSPVAEPLRLALQRAADHLLDAGADPYSVDRALVDWGLPEGPFAARDRTEMAGRPGGPMAGPVARGMAETLASRGRTGRAAGQGYYRFDAAGVRHAEDPDVVRALATVRAAQGVAARSIASEEITVVALAMMANEGARLLASGAVERPSDVDVAALHGLGFPRWRGGPMLAADEAGLLLLRNVVRGIAQARSDRQSMPDPVWDELIRNGRKFSDLNGR